MIPNEVIKIIKTLEQAGYEAYIVGGAVRNTYLRLPVKDWDITTSARPEIVESLFDKTYQVGKAFGTIIVSLSQDYEVTSYRLEDDYDGRKPNYVAFTDKLLDDLKRRDFTMNAMVMDVQGKIHDYFMGQDHLDAGHIKTVGNAVDRFKEDYLRVYRYVRFTCEYNLVPNPNIDKVIIEMPINRGISAERVREEFNKILLSDHASKGIRHLLSLGLLEYICPEIMPSVGFDQHSVFHHLNVFDHILAVVDFTPKRLSYRLAAFCHDIGKPACFSLENGQGHFYGHDKKSVELAKVFLSRLKYPKKLTEEVLLLVKMHMRLLDLDNKKSTKKFMNKIGLDNLEGYLALRKADILASTTNDTLMSVEKMEQAFNDIIEEKAPMTVNDLAINGHDLMGLGYRGQEIAKVKKQLLEMVLDKPEINTKDHLLAIVSMLDFK